MTKEELYHLPASELLKHIRTEKERLIKEKVIKKSKPLPPITEEEKPYELPVGWKWVRLGDISQTLNYGYTASATDVDTGVKMLRITDVQDNKVNWDTVPFCEISTHRLKSYVLNKDDIVIARTGGTVGKSFIIEEISCTSVFASYLIRIQLFKNINPAYIKRFIESPLYWNQLVDKTTGTGQPNVNATSLGQLILPLPPLYIQDQIVQKLEQISATKDSLLYHAESQLSYTKKMHEALLQEAIRGELVPQDENDEPASVLLEKIKAEKERLIKGKIIKKQKELPPITDEEKPYELPVGWEWVRLGDLYNVLGGKRIPKGMKFSESPTNYVYLRVADMKNGGIDCTNLQYISEDTYEKIKNYIINTDDLYLTIAGTIGRVGIIPEALNGANLTENACKLSPFYKLIDKKFMYYVLNSTYIQEIFLDKQTQSAQPKLAIMRIQTTPIPLPPLAEQERIVKKLDELLANCDQLETKAEEIKNYTTRLFEAGLKEAFMPEYC